MFMLLDTAFDFMISNLDKQNYEIDSINTEAIEKKINRFRNKLRKKHVSDIENEIYSYKIGTLYKDIFSESEKMGDYIYDVTTSIVDYVE
jgi:phosphate:Na+ symporter